MRKIKFRAWDKNRKKMIYPNRGTKYCVSFDGEVEELRPELTPHNCSNINWRPAYFIPINCVLMQFTGLHDSTQWEDLKSKEQKVWLDSGKTKEQWIGKEIYEEDIVNIRHPFDKGGDFGNTNGRVFWDGDGWAHGNQSGRPPKAMWEYCKVIGDVYKNPKSLKQNR
jgi:hypothetical protein